jgi:galactose mutarotase-like enzyme
MTFGHGIQAEEENVVIKAGDCCVTLIPQLGGKISSILIRDRDGEERELLQAPLAPLAPRTHSMPFDASDASGWDECLPSVAACSVQTRAGLVDIPDHGDLWRVVWERVGREPNSVTYRGDCFSLPLRLERSLEMSEDENGWRLSFDYTVTNLSDSSQLWSWSAHPLFAVDQGDEISLPETITTLRLEGSGGGRLGAPGASVQWPVATMANGGYTKLNIAQGIESGVGDKLSAGPLAPGENWCTLLRRETGVGIRFEFETAATPYLGLWLCYGGWPDRPGPKQMCVAIEPATAPVDSVAQTGPWSRELAARDCCSWHLDVRIEIII